MTDEKIAKLREAVEATVKRLHKPDPWEIRERLKALYDDGNNPSGGMKVTSQVLLPDITSEVRV